MVKGPIIVNFHKQIKMKKNLKVTAMLSIILSFTACAQRVVYSQNVTIVRTVPYGAAIVVHGGISYRYVNGVYYRPYGTGFRIVTPPVGILVNVLPAGFVSVNIAGRPYFCAGGVYYMQTEPNVYVVVQKPAEAIVTVPVKADGYVITQNTIVTTLPQGTILVNINNKRYYKVNDTYYEKVTTENGEISYRVVGKAQ
jgi:Family of unknown function (DUF6515)